MFSYANMFISLEAARKPSGLGKGSNNIHLAILLAMQTGLFNQQGDPLQKALRTRMPRFKSAFSEVLQKTKLKSQQACSRSLCNSIRGSSEQWLRFGHIVQKRCAVASIPQHSVWEQGVRFLSLRCHHQRCLQKCWKLPRFAAAGLHGSDSSPPPPRH